MSIIHLHAHSYYSFLDGISSPEEIALRNKELGSKFTSISDHGNCVGHIDTYKAAKKHGLLPILGTELYMRDDKVHLTKDKGLHLTLFARNLVGLHNLWDISSLSWENEDGGDSYTNTTWADLGERREGVICGSACLGGVMSYAAKHKDEALAKEMAERFSSIFDEFFIEIHTNTEPEQREVNLWLMNFAKKYSYRTVYSVDSHYIHPQQSDLQNVMLGVGFRKKYDEEYKRMKQEYYMMDEAEVRKRLAYLGDEDLQRCFDGMDYLGSLIEEYEIDTSLKVPGYDVPGGWKDEGEYLKHLVLKGLLEKVAGCKVEVDENRVIQAKGGDPKKITPHIKQLSEEEFPVIIENGLSNYFLNVADYMNYAKTKMLPGHARGSCAASVLCYATGITEIDPIGKGLVFSRFLNQTRAQSLYEVELENGQVFRAFGREEVTLADGRKVFVEDMQEGDIIT